MNQLIKDRIKDSTLLILVTLLFFAFLIWILKSCSEPINYGSQYRDALPSSATDIQEESVDLFPDWSYYLKAKITEEEFIKFIRNLELELRVKNDDIPIKGPNWWTLSLNGSVYTKTYKRSINNETEFVGGWVSATYEDGYVYLYACRI